MTDTVFLLAYSASRSLAEVRARMADTMTVAAIRRKADRYWAHRHRLAPPARHRPAPVIRPPRLDAPPGRGIRRRERGFVGRVRPAPWKV